jgi:hypothetical protein
MLRPHKAISRQPTTLFPPMLIVLVDVRCHYSQSYYSENISSFSTFVLRLLCVPLYVSGLWSCVPCTDLLLVQVILQWNRLLNLHTRIMKIRLFFILVNAGYMISEMPTKQSDDI